MIMNSLCFALSAVPRTVHSIPRVDGDDRVALGRLLAPLFDVTCQTLLTPDGADVRPHVGRGLAPLALALEKPVGGNVPFPTALAVHERQVLKKK